MQKGNIKKNKLIRYYPRELFPFYASRKVGDKAGIVEKLKEPFPEDWIYQRLGGKGNAVLGRCSAGLWWVELNFPFGATVGIPEPWDGGYDSIGLVHDDIRYKSKGDEPIWKWRSPAVMPNSAIRLLFEVTDARVCRIQEVIREEELLMGMDPYSSDPLKALHFWFYARYSKEDWDKNVYVQVAETERIEK